MKKIFIKDDRLREINADLNAEIARLMKTGELKGSYVIKESTKEFPTKEFPFYEILFGWEVTDYEDRWKIDDLGNFEITIKKDGEYYCATCEQFFTENVSCPLMVCGYTFEGTLKRFIKELKARKKTLCVRGKSIEDKLAEAIYEDGRLRTGVNNG